MEARQVILLGLMLAALVLQPTVVEGQQPTTRRGANPPSVETSALGIPAIFELVCQVCDRMCS